MGLDRGPADPSNIDPMNLEALGALELADQDGVKHRLAGFWEDQLVVLVFLRHFG